jgi:UDP-N-acetylglucosamine acyltransferase
MPEIHPSAVVHPDARIGEGTRIGAFCVIDAQVTIGSHTTLHDHVVVRSHSTIGDHTQIHPFSVIGGDPQHLRYKGELTTVRIGNRVTLREYVTVHKGTLFDSGVTSIADDAYLMAYCHVAHDCEVGEKVIFANSVHLAGHVKVGKGAVIGGLTGVTQHCAIGDYVFVGGSSLIRKDLPPFLSGKGNDFQVQGVNAVGLERNGFSEKSIRDIKELFKIFYLQKLTVSQAIEKAATELGDSPEATYFLNFLRHSKQGIVR